MSAPIAQALEAQSAQEVGHKVFVGNLGFSVDEAQLKEIFAGHGNITDAQIIYRGTRSLGYGFVTFPSESDATAAISKLDKSEVGGRKINVDMAKPPATIAAGRIAKEAAKAAVSQGKTEGEQVAEGTGEAKTKKPRNKKPKARKPRTDNETEEAGDAPEALAQQTAKLALEDKLPASDSTAEGKSARAPRKRGPKPVDAEGNPLPPRTPRPKKGPPSGPASQTQLFVANLSFSVTDETLKQAFSDYQVKSAIVITRKFGHAAGKSKGFGFVEFANEEQQQKALNSENGKEVDGRGMQLRVAIEEDRTNTQNGEPDAQIVAQ